MTINKLPNQDDVQHRSGVAGLDVNLVFSLPDEIKANTSGGATYDSTNYGTWVGSSSTSGDTGELSSLRADVLSEFSTVISTFDLWTLSFPVTDDIEIGSIDGSGANADSGAYFDLTAEQYHVGSTTVPATTPGSYDSTRLIIKEDRANNQTTFTQVGKVNESVTVDDVNSGQDNIVAYNSNGNGDKAPAVIRFKRVFIP